MTKPNKIRIKVTAGVQDLIEVRKYLEKFEQESNFKNTNQNVDLLHCLTYIWISRSKCKQLLQTINFALHPLHCNHSASTF